MHFTRADRRAELDANTVRRLLDDMEPEDAPPGYGRVAAVLRAAAGPPDPSELEMRDGFAARLSATLDNGVESRPARVAGRRSLRAGIVAVTSGVVLTCGAAVAGALPAPAQGVAAAALDRVGIHVPGPADSDPVETPTDTADTITTSTTATPQLTSTVESPTGDAATSKGNEISDLATTTDATGVDKGATISEEASDGKSHAGDPPGQNKPPNESLPAAQPDPPHGPRDDHSPPSQRGGGSDKKQP